ncbi:hypothetical protein [Nocardia sp. CNY236]|uniref:hypothetical protein n=1 Tax=Nocardia sp. CNY236 TaxID=1169152 RepID=UPI0004150B1D|nr:hypothetical protein [Nocardia sp. CNY236]
MASMEVRFGDATRTVPLPNPWNLTAYLASVATHRGRSISLHPVSESTLAGTGCGGGLWVARVHDDVIVYDAAAIGHTADHAILHVIGHMLLNHQRTQQRSADSRPSSTAMVSSSISLHSVDDVLGRADLDADQEREAEMFADMTMVYASLPRRRRRSFRLFGWGR